MHYNVLVMGSDSGILRNLGIFAHIDAGKTSLTERILFLAGRLRAPGSVDSGTTATDFLPVERERGITVKAACVRLEWKGRGINLIDTPGHIDFGSEVERSLRVLDSAVIVLCAVAGVQSRTEAVLRAAARRDLPRLAFINKLDRRGSSFLEAAGELKALVPGLIPLCLPWGEGQDFQGVLDLVELQARPSGGGALPIPPDFLPVALAGREALVEAVAETDEAILALYAAGQEVGAEALRASLRAATVSGRLVPLLCGSAFSDASVALLLDGIVDYLPSPGDRPCPEGLDPATGAPARAACEEAGAFSAFVFKTQADPSFGRLSWVRVWSGSLAPGDRVIDAGRDQALRVQKIFSIQASALEDLPSIRAGDIAALSFGAASNKGNPGSTGSSLSSPGHLLVYEALGFDEPVVSLALESPGRAEGAALAEALASLLEEDPSLRLREDGETGRLILSGMGELHLEVALERLRVERGIKLRAGAPQVSYRETLLHSADGHCDLDRSMNGERLRASLDLSLAPLPRGGGHRLGLGPGLRASASYIEAFTRGVEASLSAGPAGGWPVEDWEAKLLGFSLPGGRQDALVLEIASSLAARDALARAGTQVLEPWMRVELGCPEDCLGQAVAVLGARGGRIESVDDVGGEKYLEAAAPLRLLFGLASELRSATKGRAAYQAKFLRYEPLR